MAKKKTGIVAATNSIAPGGCGPYMAREIMAGSKPMSRKPGKIDIKGGAMGGPSGSIIRATNSIAPKGKGAYSASEIMSGERCMSGKKGVVHPRSNNNMDINSGGYRIGSGVRTFSKGLLGPAGPKSFGEKRQPMGHKKGFNT